MSKFEKLKKRFLTKPTDFTYEELVSLLSSLGYKETNRGRTSGSAVSFEKDKKIIRLHKPHPSNVLKMYQVCSILEYIKDELK